MVHYKYTYFKACNEYSDPEPVECNPSSCPVCNNPDPDSRRIETVYYPDPSAACGKVNCRVTIDLKVQAGYYHQAPGGWDANQVKNMAPSVAVNGVKNVATFGNGMIRTTQGVMTIEQWAAGGGQAGPSSSSAAGLGGSGDASGSKKDKKDKKEKKDKREKTDKNDKKEKQDKKGKGKEKKH